MSAKAKSSSFNDPSKDTSHIDKFLEQLNRDEAKIVMEKLRPSSSSTGKQAPKRDANLPNGNRNVHAWWKMMLRTNEVFNNIFRSSSGTHEQREDFRDFYKLYTTFMKDVKEKHPEYQLEKVPVPKKVVAKKTGTAGGKKKKRARKEIEKEEIEDEQLSEDESDSEGEESEDMENAQSDED